IGRGIEGKGTLAAAVAKATGRFRGHAMGRIKFKMIGRIFLQRRVVCGLWLNAGGGHGKVSRPVDIVLESAWKIPPNVVAVILALRYCSTAVFNGDGHKIAGGTIGRKAIACIVAIKY